MKNYCLLLPVVLCSLSCSNTDKYLPVFDDLLSNSTWIQNYIAPKEATTIPDADLPELFRNILDAELLLSETVTDTIWDIEYTKGKYTLSFGSDNGCRLEHESEQKGTYQLRTSTKTEYHYPDQTYSYTDADFSYDFTVKADTLFFRRTYIGEGQYVPFYEERKYIGHFWEYDLLDISEPYPCEPRTETMYFRFIRNGHEIILNGDKTITGTINDNFDEIDFNEIGIMYLE